ncbi:MAG TPA: YitT family protein [Pelotomaculum sp.]|nr:YitT family protein [Pelotomaculum sp.]
MRSKLKAYFQSHKAREDLADLLLIITGTLLAALSINFFLIPNNFLAGGVTGLALVFFYLLKIPVYLTMILLNIPIFWWGFKEINRHFLLYSLTGTLALAFFQPATQTLVRPPQIDLILAAIFGGSLSGAGLGLVLRGHGSTGGTDIIAVILRKRKNMGIGEVGFLANLLVIAVSLFFFPLNIGLYTIVSMFVASKATDAVISGLNTSKSVIIVSNHSMQIGSRIIDNMHRGVTYFAGKGAFTQEEKTIVNCVVNRFELAKLKKIVAESDPNAFVYISDASEVMGRGFTIKK